MLSSSAPKEPLLACPPFPPWNLPSLTVESALFSSCSHSDPPLSRQDAALAHLYSLLPDDLVLWTDGSFPFGKGSSGVLTNRSFCGTEATLFFSAGLECSSFRGSLRYSARSLLVSTAPISLPLLFYLTLVLSLPLCPLLHLSFYPNLSGGSGRSCPLSPPVLPGYNGSPDTRLSQEMTRLMSWTDGERYLGPLQSLAVSFLLSLVSTLFSD